MVYWAELAQELSIPKCYSARSVNLDRVLVVLTYLNDTARLVPLVGMRSCLILHSDEVPFREWWKSFRVLRPCFSCADVAFTQGFLSCFQCLTPSLMRSVFPGNNRDEIACRATEDTHCREDLCIRVGCVTIIVVSPSAQRQCPVLPSDWCYR